MAYKAEISRTSPSCFIFMIDHSGSMADPMIDAAGQTKAQILSDAINKLIQNLIIKCARSETVWDYYSVGVIGYGGSVGSAFGGPHAGHNLVPISRLADAPADVENRTKKVSDGAGGVVEQSVKFPVWFHPVASGSTPMAEAFQMTTDIVQEWASAHPDGFPPIVINISDGEADKDPSKEADRLKSTSTSDGNTLLYNMHISSSNHQPIEFPDNETRLPDNHSKLLFRMSSVLPEQVRDLVKREGIPTTEQTRGFAFNAHLASIIRFLDIGTRPQNLSAR